MSTKEELEEKIDVIRKQIAEVHQTQRYDELSNLRKKWHELDREIYLIENVSSDLEKNFIKVFTEACSKIDEQLAIANEALSNAEKISTEYGIPFNSEIVRNRDTYVPRDLSKKWDSVDKDFIRNYFEFEELSTGEYDGGSFFNGYGWTKSYC